jgi:membrane protein YqaA with SNARE-associated domain
MILKKISNLLDSAYKKTIQLSQHPHAEKYLGIISFAESSFFPIPPDVMLLPMCLANPLRAYWYAFITTITSVLGGLFGYLIGKFAFDLIESHLMNSHYYESYNHAVTWFNEWGFWAIFVAGFSPIPYKVFTIAAGSLNMMLIPFILGSIIGRGGRFFLEAALTRIFNKNIKLLIQKIIQNLGYLIIFMFIIIIFFWSKSN